MKRKRLFFLLGFFILSGSIIVFLGKNVKAEYEEKREIEQLRQSAPQYFNLSAANGLKVYFTYTKNDLFRCILCEKNASSMDVMNCFQRTCSVDEMRMILSTYDISKERITVAPICNPYSSYAMAFTDEEEADYYLQNKSETLKNQLFK